jgi:hypothetical protein
LHRDEIHGFSAATAPVATGVDAPAAEPVKKPPPAPASLGGRGGKRYRRAL